MSEREASRPPVAVVILNYNGHDDTRLCLQSLAGATYAPLSVIVCDNASSKPGLDALEGEFPAARFIRQTTNLGFAAGCNVGIAAAVERGAAYVVLLNNDTFAAPDCVEPLVAALETHPRAGIAGGTILQWNQARSDRIWYAGGRLSKLRGGIVVPRYGEPFIAAGHPAVVETGFVSGCFAMIPVRVLEEVGPLDQDFFLGVEDLDFAWRLERRRLSSLYVPRSVIWHRCGRSRAFDAGEVYRAYAAKFLLQRKHRSRPAYWAWLGAYTAYMRTTGLASAPARLADIGYVRGAPREARDAVARAMRDAWRGKLDTRPGPRA